MEQSEKSSFLLRTMSSLEGLVSALRSRMTQLEDGNMYMTEILERAGEQLNCKLHGAPEYFSRQNILLTLSLLMQEPCLDVPLRIFE
jgi:hypothetical protein